MYKKKKYTRDNQRHKVYKMEREWNLIIHKSVLDEDTMNKYHNALCRKFRRGVTLYYMNGHGCSAAYTNRIRIRREWAMNVPVLLHEWAHILTSDQHGPAFLSTYFNLLHYYYDIDIKYLCSLGNDLRLDWHSLDRQKKRLKLSYKIKPFVQDNKYKVYLNQLQSA